MRFPPALRPGDLVAAFAGSSPFDRTLGYRGLGFLAERYRVRFSPGNHGVFARDGFLAGSDERRRDELQALLDDDDVRAIVAMRGGYGLSRFAHELDWSKVTRSPKWIIGFSDVTLLHVEAATAGFASLHAHNVAGLGRGDQKARDRWVHVLESETTELVFSKLPAIIPGSAKGTIFGGNLTMLYAATAAGRLRPPRDAIWFFEDVTERPYRIDRMLHGLRVAGAFDSARALVIGTFTDCTPGPDRVTADEVVRAFAARLGLPAVTNLPVGHGRENEPLILGASATVDASRGEVVVRR